MGKLKWLFVLVLASSIYFQGCATVSQHQRQTWDETVPVCFTKSDCDAKWAAARNWVQSNAAYKIQIYADDLIETYNPEPYSPKIAARVTKNPFGTSATGTKSYILNIKVWCNNIFGCVPTYNDAILSFNKYVASAQANDETCYSSQLDNNKPLMGYNIVCTNTNKCIIKSICYNSPAFKAGLQPNDVITKSGSTIINNLKDVDLASKNRKFGDTVKVEVLRDNVSQSFQVKLPLKEEVTLIKDSIIKKDSTQQANIEEKLESLQRLLKKGLINQEEYDVKKKQLLNGL